MRWIVLFVSQYKVGVGATFWLLAEKLADNWCNQMASLSASDATMYSASMVERCRIALTRRPLGYGSTTIGEYVPKHGFPIIRIVGIIEIRVAFDLGRIVSCRSLVHCRYLCYS